MESLAYFLAQKFSIGACIFQELGRYSLKPNKIQGWEEKKPKTLSPQSLFRPLSHRPKQHHWFGPSLVSFRRRRTLFTHVDLSRSFNFPARD